MTVKELIAELQKLPQEADVYTASGLVDEVEVRSNGRLVHLSDDCVLLDPDSDW